MTLFNDLIRDLQMVDIPLKNQLYTCSSKRSAPSFSKLDKFFVSPKLTTALPMISLNALEVTVSDHAPLILECKHVHSQKQPFRLELFWLKNDCTRTRVQSVWEQPLQHHNSLEDFQNIINLMHADLRTWHCQNFGQLHDQLEACKKAIIFFDRIEERRTLLPYEYKFINMVRERAYSLACISESRWQQRGMYLRVKMATEGHL